MKKGFTGIFLLLIFITCTTTVTDKSEYIRRALVKDVVKKNDTTIVLYMDLIDSALVQNIRMVEYKAKVKNVYASMSHLASVTNKYGGYISRDNLNNNSISTSIKKLTEDSSISINQYYTSNTIMLRIPHFYMDTALKEINENLDYIDYKYSKANDSLIGIYAASKYLQRLNLSYTDETSLQKWGGQVEYDELIEEYTNSYGAIILSIYQNPEIRIESIKIPVLPAEYKTPFLIQTKIELINGWKLVGIFWFFLLRHWPIFALILLSAIVIWINYLTNKSTIQFKNWFDPPKN